MNSAIVLAGGIGSRIDSEVPKQFLIINNKLVLEYSINVFDENTNINEIILVCNADYIETPLVQKFNQKCTIVEGGKTRTQSTINGLLACDKLTENVLIHDAARPFISKKMVNDCISNLNQNDASIPIISCKDSLVNFKDSQVEYLDRNNIKLIQTPQGFNYKKILNALKDNNKNYSDDFSALLDINPDATHALFKGDYNNFKITTDTDLKLAEMISNEI